MIDELLLGRIEQGTTPWPQTQQHMCVAVRKWRIWRLSVGKWDRRG